MHDNKTMEASKRVDESCGKKVCRWIKKKNTAMSDDLEVEVLMEELTIERRISLLMEFVDEVQRSTEKLFDDNDIQQVEAEIERLKNSQLLVLEKRCKQRLERLNGLSEALQGMQTHHVTLNNYFVKKQQQMMSDLQRASTLGQAKSSTLGQTKSSAALNEND